MNEKTANIVRKVVLGIVSFVFVFGMAFLVAVYTKNRTLALLTLPTAYLLWPAIVDFVVHRHPIDGFVERNKTEYVTRLSVCFTTFLSIKMLSPTSGYAWSFGILAGYILGGFINHSIGWVESVPAEDQRYRLGFLATLLAFANATPKRTPREQTRLEESTRFILDPVGVKGREEIDQWLRDAESFFAETSMSEFISNLESAEWKQTYFHHACMLTYSTTPPAPARMELLHSLYEWSGFQDEPLFRFYDRETTLSPEQKQRWLKLLNLPSDATEQQIRIAEREITRQYATESTGKLPPDLAEAARKKVEQVNEAVRGLLGTQRDISELEFRPLHGHTPISPEPDDQFSCRCWLCAAENRIGQASQQGEARCQSCFALLGKSSSLEVPDGH
ncbi:MAG: hypothetical protein R3C11_27105 [Planctomycetaceae bacterium]